MMEPAWIMIMWSTGTVLVAAGAAWGAVRATQKQFKESLTNVQAIVRKSNEKIQEIDKEYVSHPQCHTKQNDCLNNHRVWEGTVTSQLVDLKTMITVMDEKREATRFDTMARIQQLQGQESHGVSNDQLQDLFQKLIEKLT